MNLNLRNKKQYLEAVKELFQDEVNQLDNLIAIEEKLQDDNLSKEQRKFLNKLSKKIII